MVVERLLREYGARVLAIREDFTVFETTGHKEETEKLIKVFENYGLIEFVRSARIAIIKKVKVSTKKLKNLRQKNLVKKFRKMNS
jgi:acetolactate synthase-1/3 small subunit